MEAQEMTALELTEQEADWQADKARAELMARRQAVGLRLFAWAVIGGLAALIVAALWGLAMVAGI